jgi:hypothetical protein
MSDDDYPDDSVLTQELRDSLSHVATSERPPLAQITSRGRAHHRRRLAAVAGFGGAGVAAGTALALGLTGALSTGALGTGGPAAAGGASATRTTAAAVGSTGAGSKATAGTPGTIETAAFTLTGNANGTDTLVLTMKQVFDPAVFQQALAQHGIPALVKSGEFCTSSPAPANPAAIGVLSIQLPAGLPHQGKAMVATNAQPSSELIADTKTVIDPARIPTGTELFFGYSSSGHALFFDLIYPGSYSCSSDKPPMSRS